MSHSPPQRKDLGPTQKLLLQLIQDDPDATVLDLANRMGRSVPVIRNMIRRLAEIHGIHTNVPGGQ